MSSLVIALAVIGLVIFFIIIATAPKPKDAIVQRKMFTPSSVSTEVKYIKQYRFFDNGYDMVPVTETIDYPEKYEIDIMYRYGGYQLVETVMVDKETYDKLHIGDPFDLKNL